MGSTLDALRTQIQDAEPVLKRLDDEIEQLQYDPLVASSVETAKLAVDELIESLLGQFRGNRILEPLMTDLKTQYLQGIEAQVADAAASNRA